jgi:hypothetical protein
MLVAALLLGPALLPAQETTGDIRGRLRAADSGAVAGAEVIATSPDLLGERRAVSASDGTFLLLLLPPGRYALRVRHVGIRSVAVTDVPVLLGRTTGLGTITMERAGIVLEEIVVAAPALTLDPVRATVGATLTAEDYALLPAERDYRSAIAVLPHVNASYQPGDLVNVGGSSGLENMWFIDGMNVTSTLRANSSTSLPYNFVRTVEVKAGGYEAQFGRALGSVVNAITYSGTNDREGQVFGFFTHDALTAEPRALPVLQESGALTYDLGARVGGPVMRDRLWYSAAYNPRVSTVDKEVTGLGVFEDRTTAHIFAGKLTWAATPRATVELSILGDPTVRHSVEAVFFAPDLTPLNEGPLRARVETGGITGSLRATAAVGAGLLLEAGIARTSQRSSTLPETQTDSTTPLYADYVAGTISGGAIQIEDVSEGRTSGLLRASVALDRHTLVAGLEYEDARVTRAQSWPGRVHIFREDSSAWSVLEEATAGTFHNRSPVAYVQDTWRPLARLSVNFGVRWSRQTLVSPSGAIAQRFDDEWQPRLGFSWQLGPEPTQRLFGSYGRFYQTSPLFLSALSFADYTAISSQYSTDPRQPGSVPDLVNDWSTTEAQGLALAGHVGLELENFDEFTLGFERLLGPGNRLTVRAIRRDLRSSFQLGLDPSLPTYWVIGTPGKGDFDFLPPPRREYTALELALSGSSGRLDYRTSYVLSRTWGNYAGLYNSDADAPAPGLQSNFNSPASAVNTTGLLPNDRTHVLKLTATYRPVRPLAVGAFLAVASGVPENEMALTPYFTRALVSPRGTVGRTPALWDLSVRTAFDVDGPQATRGRIVLDLLHVGNPRGTTAVDEQHYRGTAPNNPNPDWLRPTGYQPPMAARLGMEVAF